MKNLSPLVLCILDGWGLAPRWGGNAIEIAEPKNMQRYWKDYPHSELVASGRAVGLPGQERGNSETGHLNIGAGKIVRQDYSLITSYIEDESFFENKTLRNAADYARRNQSSVHLLGLITENGVHAHSDHCTGLLEFFKQQQISQVFVHAFTDGRDSDPKSSEKYLNKVETRMKELRTGAIASISGRYYAMDRDRRWDRIQKAYDTIISGTGPKAANWRDVIHASYKKGVTDEFILPSSIIQKNGGIITIKDNDAVIFFNFRSDRIRQMAQAITVENFGEFKRERVLKKIFSASFVQYEEKLPIHTIFEPERARGSLPLVLAEKNLKQFHIAETEKYAHVTYFFAGGHEKNFSGEERKLIPSLKVATYDLAPQMRAREITDELIKAIESEKYQFLVCNLANADMVGHTGNIPATIEGIRIIDECLEKIKQAVDKQDGCFIITSDHGNAEEMLNPSTGEMDTEHSRNPVPFIIISNQTRLANAKLRLTGVLADIAPTILDIYNIPKPEEMTGKSLIVS